MTRENPAHSVAELRDISNERRLGTAFAIAPLLAVTAFHCVRGSNRVLLRFPENSAAASVVRHDRGGDEDNDVGLLRLEAPLPASVPKLLIQGQVAEDVPVIAIGFPLAMATPRFVVGGSIRSAHAEHPARRHSDRPDRYIQWFCEEALSGVALRGLSGGPLLAGPPDRRVAVGVVIYNEVDREGAAKGAAIWASPMATLGELWSAEVGPLVRQRPAVIRARPAGRTSLDVAYVGVEELRPDGLAGAIHEPRGIAWLDERRLTVGTSTTDVLLVYVERGESEETAKLVRWPARLDELSGNVLEADREGGRDVAASKPLIAATSYHDVGVLNLESGSRRHREVDPKGSVECLAWRRDAELLAAGSDNVLCLLTAQLEPCGNWAVGGKHGIASLAFVGTSLWVGLGSGDLWRLDPPYEEPVEVQRRNSPLIGIAGSAEQEIAAVWLEGFVEVRSDDELLDEVRVEGADAWTRQGLKITWTPDSQRVLWCTGVDARLFAWEPASGAIWQSIFEGPLTCLAVSPDGRLLVLGVGTRLRVGGELVTLATRRLREVTPAMQQARPRPEGHLHTADWGLRGVTPVVQEARPRPVGHLLTADWETLFDLLAENGGEDNGPIVRIEVPELDAEFERWSAWLAEADIARSIRREVRRRLERTRERVGQVSADLAWLAEELDRAGYTETEKSRTLDTSLSFVVNDLLAILEKPGYPESSNVAEWVAFTLGENREDLLRVVFRSSASSGNVYFHAEVPSRLLASLGHKQEFKMAMTRVDQRRLWTTAVLPQAFARYSREELVIDPSDVYTIDLYID